MINRSARSVSGRNPGRSARARPLAHRAGPASGWRAATR